MEPGLPLSDDERVLVLTGAGISAESGVPTFRDARGLWRQHRFEEVASPEGFQRDPSLVWQFYSERRRAMEGVVPNAAHRSLVDLEQSLGDRFLLVTQNVDGLHQAAGSQRVINLHGELFVTRCDGCSAPPFQDRSLYLEGPPPRCPTCGSGLLRPHIVWFGEVLDEAALERIDAFMHAAGAALRFLAVGTSGAVYPAAALVQLARRHGGETWLINAEAADNRNAFDHFTMARASSAVPQWVDGLLGR